MKIGLIGRAATIAVLTILLGPPGKAQEQSATPPPESAFSIPRTQLMQPAELNRLLHARSARKPLVLQVGFRMMFEEAHIMGAEYAGPASQPGGLRQLQERVQPLAHSTLIVLYCGCCPWNHCPNIAPAFHLLRSMGFTRVKALYLADNFGTNWVDKGYLTKRVQ